MLKPYKQGHDNGLCSLFAVTNAVRWLWPELCVKNSDDEEYLINEMRKRIILSLNPVEFRDLYLEGDEQHIVKELMLEVKTWLQDKDRGRINVYNPFANLAPADARTYWATVCPLLKHRNKVAIIGLENPDPHWTVITHKVDLHKVKLFDSDDFDTIDIRETVIGKTDGKSWELDTDAVFIVERL